jgi:hypothetical protein
MRMRRYLLAECLVLASALAGTALLVRGAVRLAFAQREGSRRAADSRSKDRWPASSIRQRRPARTSSRELAGTFMGMEDDFLIARLRSQPIVRMKFNKGGSSLSFRVDFADGSRAAFKPAQTNLQTIPRREVAAYRINRLLGLARLRPPRPRW